MSIFLLSGEIATGKTTALFKAVQTSAGCAGLLSPVIDGKRFLFDITNRALFRFEAEPGEERAVTIGRYRFSEHAFIRGNRLIHEAIASRAGLIILDEAGPLELRGEGFAECLPALLNYGAGTEKSVIIVSRSSAENDFRSKFGGSLPITVIKKADVAWAVHPRQ